MDKINKEKLKNIVKVSSEDFIKIQKRFFTEIDSFSHKIKNAEKSKNYLELQREAEKMKKFIQDYNMKYLKNINEEQIKYTKKLIESLENKLNTIKMQIALVEKKKIIEKKMHEKYLERRNTTGNNSFEDCSFFKKNEKEISNRRIIDSIIDSSVNLLKFCEIFNEINKENQNINKIYQNSNNHLLISPIHTENKGIYSNIKTNPHLQGRLASVNNNSDFNVMNRLPSMNFNNNFNFESYFILDNKNINNNPLNNVSKPVNQATESPNLNFLTNDCNLTKYVEEIKSIKNSCINFVEFLRDDPNYIKKAENDISILKDEILKDYLKYKKLKKHIKNIMTKNKN